MKQQPSMLLDSAPETGELVSSGQATEQAPASSGGFPKGQAPPESQRIRTTEISDYVGETVRLQGWLHAVRQLGGITFVILRDGWGTAQAVTESSSPFPPNGLAQTSEEPQLESIIELVGTVVASSQAPGGYELHQPTLTVLSVVEEPLPVLISKREVKAAIPTVLDNAVVVNRHPARRAIFTLAATIMAGFREYLTQHHFTEIQSPKIVASATESGANVFTLDYFGQPAYLAQSPQFYKQILVGVFERVFEVGPVFRAEPHDTARHVNEYVSLDVEFGFIENHFSVLARLRNVLNHIVECLAAQNSAELSLLGVELPSVPSEIPWIHFEEAKALIHQRHQHEEGYVDERNEPDLSPQEERWLGAWAMEEHGSDFLAVTGYPMSKRPFYTYADPARPEWSYSFDLLFRGTELVTGGQRLHRYQDYLAALDKASLPMEPFEHYLQAFRFGMPPHGGFAIGLERLLMQLTGVSNLRLATLFPRTMNRVAP